MIDARDSMLRDNVQSRVSAFAGGAGFFDQGGHVRSVVRSGALRWFED